MNTITLPSNFSGLQAEFSDAIKYFKGNVDINFDVSSIFSLQNPIIKLVMDFNDESPKLIRNFSFDNPSKIVEPIVHKYIPSEDYYNIVYYPTIFITFANFNRFVYQVPVRISKESFYSKYEKIKIAACQFIDDSDNSLFITLDTINGDIINLKLK